MKKIAFALLFVTVPVWAELPPAPLFQSGDVVVASAEPACAVDPPPPASDQLALHGRDASRVKDLTSPLIGTARYISGWIYATTPQSIVS